MPQALEVDWGAARALRIQGRTYQEIADMIGVSISAIKSRFMRKGWNTEICNSVAKTREIEEKTLQKLATSATLDATAYKIHAERLVKKHLNALEAVDIERLKDCATSATTLKAVNDTAKTVYGLDNAAVNVAVNMVNLDSSIPEVQIDGETV
jgi:transposase